MDTCACIMFKTSRVEISCHPFWIYQFRGNNLQISYFTYIIYMWGILQLYTGRFHRNTRSYPSAHHHLSKHVWTWLELKITISWLYYIVLQDAYRRVIERYSRVATATTQESKNLLGAARRDIFYCSVLRNVCTFYPIRILEFWIWYK